MLIASSGVVSLSVLEFSFSDTNPLVRKVSGIVTKTCTNVTLPGCDGDVTETPNGDGTTTTNTAGTW